jgi:hypothetical protein
MRIKFAALSVIFSLTGTMTASFAETEVVSKVPMSFEDCLGSIRKVSSQLGVAPTNVVETNILRIVRFTTNDGSGESILITCSGPDNLQIVNKTK